MPLGRTILHISSLVRFNHEVKAVHEKFLQFLTKTTYNKALACSHDPEIRKNSYLKTVSVAVWLVYDIQF